MDSKHSPRVLKLSQKATKPFVFRSHLRSMLDSRGHIIAEMFTARRSRPRRDSPRLSGEAFFHMPFDQMARFAATCRCQKIQEAFRSRFERRRASATSIGYSHARNKIDFAKTIRHFSNRPRWLSGNSFCAVDSLRG